MSKKHGICFIRDESYYRKQDSIHKKLWKNIIVAPAEISFDNMSIFTGEDGNGWYYRSLDSDGNPYNEYGPFTEKELGEFLLKQDEGGIK